MGRASYSMWLTLVEEYTSNGSDISYSNLQVGQKGSQSTRTPRGRIFEFKPNGSEFWAVQAERDRGCEKVAQGGGG